VVAPDRPGFLASVVGLLALHGQSVRTAQAWSSDTGTAVDEFELEAVFDRTPDWARFADELREVLADRRSLDAPIEQRARTYERRPAAARPAEPLVLVHDDASEQSTVVEVRAADAVGLLYRVTRAISGLGFDIRHARVATLGHEAVDTFYLRDADGRQLTHEQGDRLRTTVLAELDAPSQAGA
jgi:[protein-PII] uridylyltransferase